jgi:hypothetical protein
MTPAEIIAAIAALAPEALQVFEALYAELKNKSTEASQVAAARASENLAVDTYEEVELAVPKP